MFTCVEFAPDLAAQELRWSYDLDEEIGVYCLIDYVSHDQSALDQRFESGDEEKDRPAALALAIRDYLATDPLPILIPDEEEVYLDLIDDQFGPILASRHPLTGDIAWDEHDVDLMEIVRELGLAPIRPELRVGLRRDRLSPLAAGAEYRRRLRRPVTARAVVYS